MKNSVEAYLFFLLFFLAIAAPIGLVGWYYNILTTSLTVALVIGFPFGGALVILALSFLLPAAGTWRDENENPSANEP